MIRSYFIRKSLFISLLLLSSCDFFFSYNESTTDSDKSPYLKYSPEQCIKDIDCAWYAFEAMVFARNNDTELPKVVTKWTLNPIYLSIAGDEPEKKRFLPIIEKKVNELSEIIEIPIIISKKQFNIIVVLSDDFERDIYGRYKKDLRKMFAGRSNFFESYERLFKGSKCFASGVVSPETYEVFLDAIFVPVSLEKENFLYCFVGGMSQSLGFIAGGRLASYTAINNSYMATNLTILDKFLLKILYHKSIKSGMKSKEVKPLFHNIYKTINLKSFTEKYSQ